MNEHVVWAIIHETPGKRPCVRLFRTEAGAKRVWLRMGPRKLRSRNYGQHATARLARIALPAGDTLESVGPL